MLSALRNRKILFAAMVGAAVLGGVAWWLSGDSRVGEVTAEERFDAVDCQGRFFESSPALALMFTSPLDRHQDFRERLAVVDLGEDPATPRQRKAAKAVKEGGDKGAGQSANTPQPELAAAKEGSPVSTYWVLGENPRMIYLPNITPKHRYRVVLKSELASVSRETLGKDLGCEVVAEAMPPAFYFASKGTVLPAHQNGGLPIVTVNVPEVDIQFLRVEPAQLPRFLERVVGRKPKKASADNEEEDNEDYYDYGRPHGPQGALQSYELDQLRGLSKSVYLGRFVADPRPNRRNITHVPVEDIRELQEPGIYIAVMNEPGRFRSEFQTTYFYVSDIGIHVRRYADSLDAYSTSLRSGQALPGVEFQLLDENGKSLGSAGADGDGHARFSLKPGQARVITAKRGSEFSLLSLIEPALDLSEFDTGGYLSRPVKMFAYAGRDLYRPGESFEASVLVRDLDGNPVPPAPVTATLKRADGKVVQQFTVKPEEGKPGYLRKTISLPQDAQTGTWSLELRADPAAKVADNVLKLQVEEFLPERMKLDLKTAKPFLEPGDEFEIAAKGAYLYGAPAAGNRLMAAVATERQRIPFPKEWPGFEFGSVDDDALKKREEVPSVSLDEEGEATLNAPLPKDQVQSPLSIRASVSLLESGGRPVVRSIERTLWPAEKMIGVRPLWNGSFLREGSAAEFEVIRTTREGKFAPMPKVTLRAFREDREYYWVYDDDRGWHSGYHEGNELVETREFDLSQRAKVSFPTKWGRYRIEISDRETGQTLRYRFYSGWGAQEAELLGNRPDRVQLKLDKSGYHPGDDMRLTITPPHDGEALILVEGDRALYQKRTSVSAKGTTIDIPIGKDWNRHDLYVSAVVFRPGSRSEQVTPARAVGITYLPIDREDRKLAVKMTAPAKMEPMNKLKVHLKAEGLANEAAVATVSAVDVGILNITRYATPDAFDFFLGKQRYQPDVLDLYGKFIETMEGTKGRLKFGGDASMRESKKTPQKVKLVDLFSGPVMLNAQGEADIALDVPDFNGTLRLMAVVASPNKFAKAEAEVVSAASIVAELATPRFVSPGDHAAVALDLTNMTSEPQTLQVKVGSTGPVKVSGLTESVSLKPMQKKTLRMTAEAVDAAGQGIITVDVKGAGKSALKVHRESALFISPLVPQERMRRFQRIEAGSSLKVDASMIDGYYPGSALMSVTLSPTPPFNVSELVKDLLHYPYGCLEQTTSKAFPYVLLDDNTAQSFGLKAIPRAEREHAVVEAISRLSGLQRASGAFTLWGDGPDEPWLTAYVSDFLRAARAAGYSVPDDMVKRADEWMLKQLQQAGTSFPAKRAARKDTKDQKPDDAITRDAAWWADVRDRDLAREGHRRFGALAYMGYILAQDERAPLSALRTLYDDYRDRTLSPLPLVHLGLALKRMGDEKRAGKAFEAASAATYGMTGYDWEWLGDYGTRMRDTALAFYLLDKNGVDAKRRDNLLGELIEQLPRARWLSTQEQMSLVLAAKSLAGVKSESWQAKIESASPEALESKTTEMREFDAAALKRGVTLNNTGKGILYVALEASGYPNKPREAKDDVIQLKRTLYEPSGAPVGDRALKVGEQLLVHLEVMAKRRVEDGLVVDRVPAGLEIENLNLSQGSKLADFKAPDNGSEYRPGWGKRKPRTIADSMSDERVKHREFRDDRFVAAARLEGVIDLYYLVRVVTPGQFVVPPSFAEDMYRPEVRGLTTGGASLSVVDRN